MLQAILNAGAMIKIMWVSVIVILVALFFIPFAVLIVLVGVGFIMLLAFCARCIPQIFSGTLPAFCALFVLWAIFRGPSSSSAPASYAASLSDTCVVSVRDRSCAHQNRHMRKSDMNIPLGKAVPLSAEAEISNE